MLACIKDDFQSERLAVILQSKYEIKGVAVGLIPMAREFAMNKSKYNVSHSSEGPAYTYINIIKTLRGSSTVRDWMSEEGRKSAWAWMEQWLEDDRSSQTSRGRQGGRLTAIGNIVGNVNATFESDSEEEDLGAMVVSGAGVQEINGRYGFSGIFDKVGKWTKEGDRTGTMCLYRCKLDDNSRRWYLSVVPRGKSPGTKDDVDFYQHYGYNDKYNVSKGRYPPEDEWKPVVKHGGRGMEPGPTVTREGLGGGGHLDDDVYEDVPELSYV